MKKFNCKVTKEYEYEIEIDEEIWSEINLKEWSEVFTDISDLQELVEYIASIKTNYEAGEFIEGLGIPMINGRDPYVREENKKNISRDINIHIITDGELTVESDEIFEE
jgi:hypothetical protein